MNKGYERLVQLTKLLDMFQAGTAFNKTAFKQALTSHSAKQLFDSLYLKDLNCSGYWLMWDFSDRFARFANALCTAGYCEKIKDGYYIVL